jgi:hypothetical protein
MKEFDIHHGKPTVEAAISLLKLHLSIQKRTEKVIKIIHGYGSSGMGGKIKIAAREYIEEEYHKNRIQDYIPGEAIYTPMGFDETIRSYKSLIQMDSDYKKGNDGITYVFFK